MPISVSTDGLASASYSADCKLGCQITNCRRMDPRAADGLECGTVLRAKNLAGDRSEQDRRGSNPAARYLGGNGGIFRSPPLLLIEWPWPCPEEQLRRNPEHCSPSPGLRSRSSPDGPGS